MNAILFLLTLGMARHCLAVGNADFQLEMVADFVHTLHYPKSVVTGVCWTLQRKTGLAIRLGKLENTATILFANMNSFLHNLNSKSNIIFIVDDSCDYANHIIEQANKTRRFSSPYRWLFLESNSKENYISTVLEMLNVFPDSEVVAAVQHDNNSYILELVYRIGNDKPLRREPFASWVYKDGFQKAKSLAISSPIRRLDLEGYTLPFCYVTTVNKSISELENRENGLVDTITKVSYHTTNYLYDYLNASRGFIFTNTWGYKVNGSWNGMTGCLVREEAEIGGTPLFLTAERMSYIDYISSSAPAQAMFVFLQPNLSYENNLFLLSFRTAVWYSCIALIFLLFLVLFGVAFWEWKKNDGDKKVENGRILRAKLGDILVMVLGAACQQGSVVELKGGPGRLVLLVLFLTVMFMYTSYCANIVALVQSSSNQIQTLEDLLNSKIKCGVQDVVYNRYYFSTATEPVRKAIYQKKVAPPGATPRFMDLEEGVKHMAKGLFAFHMETGVGYKYVAKYLDESQKCRLKEIKFLQVYDSWLGIRKNTPYKEMFTIGMRRIKEHGLQSRENLLFYENKPKCTRRGASFMSVSMVDCYPVVVMLIYGVMLALFVLAIEIILYRREEILEKIHCLRRLSHLSNFYE